MVSARAARLIEKIRRSAGTPMLPARVRVGVRRTYAGRHQKSEGSWVWFLVDLDTGHPLPVGSQVRLSDLTGAITVDECRGEWNVDPA